MPSDEETRRWEELRAGVIGLGAHSTRKSYYPELQRRLKELERFRSLLDEARELILLAELPDGRIVDANRHARQHFGLEDLDAYPVTLEDLFPGEDPASGRGNRATNVPEELDLLDSDGEARHFETSVRTMHFHDADYLGVVASDVTERMALLEAERRNRSELERLVHERTAELRRANEHLVEATKAKDDFLASMSHELRTPLNSILGFSGIMLQGLTGELEPEQRRQLEMISNAGTHLLGLIEQVLDLSVIESSGFSPDIEAFSASEILQHVASLVEPLAESKGLELVVEPCETDSTIESDRRRVTQILLNLAGNAVKFTESGCVALSARCDPRARAVDFRVSDTGPGISPRDRRRIWESFVKGATNESAIRPGAGLGLAISREIAEWLRGTLELEESRGEGSTFRLRLPTTWEQQE